MPHLTFRNTTLEQVKNFSAALSAPLAAAVGCPADWFTFSHIESQTYCCGETITSDLLRVDIHWLTRDQACKDKVANLLEEGIRALLPKQQDIAIIFFDIPTGHYYENGDCF